MRPLAKLLFFRQSRALQTRRNKGFRRQGRFTQVQRTKARFVGKRPDRKGTKHESSERDMTDMPERIWAGGFVSEYYAAGKKVSVTFQDGHCSGEHQPGWIEYIRADVAEAMVAAALLDASNMIEPTSGDVGIVMDHQKKVRAVLARLIRRRIVRGHRATLDFMLAAAREEGARDMREQIGGVLKAAGIVTDDAVKLRSDWPALQPLEGDRPEQIAFECPKGHDTCREWCGRQWCDKILSGNDDEI